MTQKSTGTKRSFYIVYHTTYCDYGLPMAHIEHIASGISQFSMILPLRCGYIGQQTSIILVFHKHEYMRHKETSVDVYVKNNNIRDATANNCMICGNS